MRLLKKPQLVNAFQGITCLIFLLEKGGELLICIFLCVLLILRTKCLGG